MNYSLIGNRYQIHMQHFTVTRVLNEETITTEALLLSLLHNVKEHQAYIMFQCYKLQFTECFLDIKISKRSLYKYVP